MWLTGLLQLKIRYQDPDFAELSILAIQHLLNHDDPETSDPYRKMMVSRYNVLKQNDDLENDPYPACLQQAMINLAIQKKMFVFQDESIQLKMPIHIGDDSHWYFVRVKGFGNDACSFGEMVIFEFFDFISDNQDALASKVTLKNARIGEFVRVEVYRLPKRLLDVDDVTAGRVNCEQAISDASSTLLFALYLPIVVQD